MELNLAKKLFKILKTPNQIISVMKESGWDWRICNAGIPGLKLQEKTPNQILSIMEESGWNSAVCQIGIKLLKK